MTPYLLVTFMGLALATPLASQAPPAAPQPQTVSAERLGQTLDALCRLPRLAGSIESLAAIDYATEVFTEAGFTVVNQPYLCYLPRQKSQSLQMLAPGGDWQALDLREVGFKEDPRTLSNHAPPMHGLTGTGRAEGLLWYCGYGTENEFAELERRYGREAFAGGIALVRYGALYRGLKVANAEAYGFAGALLYTNADDDGAAKGLVLPDGPWRPASGIQRGSVYNADGDPLTPGWPALEHANRIRPDQVKGLVRIPSLPISSGNAERLLYGAKRQLGPLKTSARLSVEQDPNLVEIQDVFGIVEGATHPDEWVILGAHRDSWGFGATDNGTGSTVLLETARVVGAAVKAGWRPERTLIFATWDGEEWGLVGSTEWVEHHRAELMQKAVAYVNMDVAATGPNFSASCTPGLVAATAAACTTQGITVPSRLGVPGGGSDHVPFLELAGVEVLNFGFRGGSGVYHSAMDTPFLVEKFLDPEFQYHKQAAEMAVSLVNHLSTASSEVDGRRAWVQHILGALRRFPTDSEEKRIAKLQLENATLRYGLLVETSDAEAADSFRFHRAFLPANGRSLLWRSEGYGSAWFPEVAAALEKADDPETLKAAVAAVLAGFESLSTSL
ncbi:MAG: M28 family peptidase [Planctomycetota bacterium]|nr:M28 family peptidase [Planctomycetota bacterium]